MIYWKGWINIEIIYQLFQGHLVPDFRQTKLCVAGEAQSRKSILEADLWGSGLLFEHLVQAL